MRKTISGGVLTVSQAEKAFVDIGLAQTAQMNGETLQFVVRDIQPRRGTLPNVSQYRVEIDAILSTADSSRAQPVIAEISMDDHRNKITLLKLRHG